MFETDSLFPAIEIAYLAISNANKPECKSGFSRIDEIEINQARQKFLERIDGIQRCLLEADLGINTPYRRRIGIIKTGHTSQQRCERAPRSKQSGF